MKKLIERILNHPRVVALIEFTQRVSLPGFDDIPMYDVGEFFIKEIQRDILTVRARAIAFSFFLALFPTILFFFNLIPYLPVANLQDNLLMLMNDVLPDDAFAFLEKTIVVTVTKQRGDLLSVSLLLAMFFSTNGMIGVMSSFDKTNMTFKKRNPFQKRWVAIKLTFILFLVALVSISMIMIGNWGVTYVLDLIGARNIFNVIMLTALEYLIIIFLFFNSISFIYYYGPAVKKKWRFISAGSTVATLLTILFSIGFSFFVNNFATYNKLYGSIGTIIALLLWMYFNALALLLGFELNASIAYNRKVRDEKEAEEK